MAESITHHLVVLTPCIDYLGTAQVALCHVECFGSAIFEKRRLIGVFGWRRGSGRCCCLLYRLCRHGTWIGDGQIAVKRTAFSTFHIKQNQAAINHLRHHTGSERGDGGQVKHAVRGKKLAEIIRRIRVIDADLCQRLRELDDDFPAAW